MSGDGVVTISQVTEQGEVISVQKVQNAPIAVNPHLLYLVTVKDFVDDERRHRDQLEGLLRGRECTSKQQRQKK